MFILHLFTHERKRFLNCNVIKHFKVLESQKIDLFLLKTEIHFQKHFLDVEGHYDPASILTSSFVNEYQSQGNILFKISHGRPSRGSQRDCVYLIFFLHNLCR